MVRPPPWPMTPAYLPEDDGWTQSVLPKGQGAGCKDISRLCVLVSQSEAPVGGQLS